MESTSFSTSGPAPSGINGAEVGNLLGYRKTIARLAATNEVFASLVAPKFGVNVPPVIVLGKEWDRVTIMSVGIRGRSYFQFRTAEAAAGRDLPRAKASAEIYLSNYAPDLVTFDKEIGNTDRHGGNFIIGDDGQTWGIDHEFLGGARYKAAKQMYAAEWAVACSLTGYVEEAVQFVPVNPGVARPAGGGIPGCGCGCSQWTPQEPSPVEEWNSPVESYPVRDESPVGPNGLRPMAGCCCGCNGSVG